MISALDLAVRPLGPPSLASIPSPSRSVIEVGPLPLRAYALCILAGVVAAIVIGQRRWTARGGEPGVVADIAAIAVPAGIVGSRIYHVVTSPDAYFGDGGHPVDALKIWEGGLGIWGGIAGGALGAWWACRRRGMAMPPFMDALAPALLVAQALGRFGNWFNQELYGRATDLPWAVEIDADHRPNAAPDEDTYHPTFLYEALWNLTLAVMLIRAEKRFGLRNGQVFALYVAGYCLGRLWIELLRVDPAERILGLRLNVWTSVLLLVAGVAAFVWRGRGDGTRSDGVAASAVD